MNHARVVAASVLLCGVLLRAAAVHGEVVIRWDGPGIPPPQSLGISTVAVPATSTEAVRRALAQGYRVYLEVDASDLPRLTLPAGGVAAVVVRGAPVRAHLAQTRERLERAGARLLVIDERAKWPHIRSNLVTRNNEILQVTGRSAQPWIETNAALARILRDERPDPPVLITYRWSPPAAGTPDAARLEEYLTAIAEAGSFGMDLLLPLHEHFQRELAAGDPRARTDWEEIRRHLDFYAWDAAARREPLATIGVVTSQPMFWFDVLNLLARHNQPFERVDPSRLAPERLSGFDVLVALDAEGAAEIEALAAYARRGGTLVVGAAAGGAPPWRGAAPPNETNGRRRYPFGAGQVIELANGPGNPDAFALWIRQLIGRDRRLLDIWNGITVVAAPFRAPYSSSVLVSMINYAQRPLPVQLRIRGRFSVVRFESPEQPAILLPCTERDGHTEFVVPALRIGGRVFLSP